MVDMMALDYSCACFNGADHDGQEDQQAYYEDRSAARLQWGLTTTVRKTSIRLFGRAKGQRFNGA